MLFTQAVTIPEWHPRFPNDLRAPCPLLNTLANHAILPHSGRDISQADLVSALKIIGISETIAEKISQEAVQKFGIADKSGVLRIHLDSLSKHNVIEHDSSLSRPDAHFGDQSTFSEERFSIVNKFFEKNEKEYYLTLSSLAKWRTYLEDDCLKNNPNCELNFKVKNVIAAGEACTLFLLLNRDGKLYKEDLDLFFKKEKFPDVLNEVSSWSLASSMLQFNAQKIFYGYGGNDVTNSDL
ncbi:hypothetical protein HDU92_004572 [Lobulomyces angularis]|nr:hypothetical protein HDU92_004572 [Lobulomyces angularis]